MRDAPPPLLPAHGEDDVIVTFRCTEAPYAGAVSHANAPESTRAGDKGTIQVNNKPTPVVVEELQPPRIFQARLYVFVPSVTYPLDDYNT